MEDCIVNFLFSMISTFFIEMVFTILGVSFISIRVFFGAAIQVFLISLLYAMSGGIIGGYNGFIVVYFVAFAIATICLLKDCNS